MKKKLAILGIMVFLITVGLTNTIHAATGDLDTTFGTGGKVSFDFSGIGNVDFIVHIALQDNGQIIAAGGTFPTANQDFALTRLNADGSLDSAFGTDGKVTLDFSADSRDETFWFVTQNDGKIVVIGTSDATGSNDFALARFNPDGSLDTSFGTGGKVTTDFSGSGSDDESRGAVLQADGKIVVAGFIGSLSTQDFALARYNSDGTLDSSFGSAGKVITDLGGVDAGEAVTIEPDGKIIVVGGSSVAGDRNFAVVRYNTDGSLDTSFGSGGIVMTDLGSDDDIAWSVVLQEDGKIILGGHSHTGGTAYRFSLARYNTDGSLDTGFGSGGIVTASLSDATNSEATSLAIQPDGKIIAAGYANFSGSDDFVVVRYNSDGSLDTSFGSSGIVTTDFSGATHDDIATTVALQSDGKIIAAGQADNAGVTDFALARYLNDIAVDESTGGGCSLIAR